MKSIIAALDNVADKLQAAGQPALATAVDSVTNTIVPHKDLHPAHPEVFQIPTDLALSMTGYDRLGADSVNTPEQWAALREDIKANGIKKALRIESTPDGKSAFVASGNHRVQIAKELGLETVPVYMADYSGIVKAPRHNIPRDQVMAFVAGRMDGSEPTLKFEMQRQEDDVSCGPNSLAAVYKYFGMGIPRDQVVREVETMPNGGTISVLLGLDAIKRGMSAKVYVCDLNTFDPSWKTLSNESLSAKLLEQLKARDVDQKFEAATRAYVRYLLAGGEISFDEVNKELLSVQFRKGCPVIAGLSATWLYQSMREFTGKDDLSVMDDMKGGPAGHFVVLHGIDEAGGVQIADPSRSNPFSEDPYYSVNWNKFLQALMLGALTYDSSLLILNHK